MEYHYNHLLNEIRQLVNRPALIWMCFMTGLALIIGVLCLCGIIPAAALWQLLWIIPTGIGLAAAVRYYHKKAAVLVKREQIAVMAHQAKLTMDSLQQQFPDTFISDCRIKIRYLAKKGIDVDRALAGLDNNVEKYNELALSFLRESDQREDELYDFMQADTLLQYAAKAHLLRIKANELGIINLTDTAFFHEIEACAGQYEVVRDNWKKLSFELDEAYDSLNEYINSIGLKDTAVDKDGNHMTFKKWGEQLDEAVNALETSDTIKAKKILSELIKYQIDADMTNTLQGIITGIDEMTAVSK